MVQLYGRVVRMAQRGSGRRRECQKVVDVRNNGGVHPRWEGCNGAPAPCPGHRPNGESVDVTTADLAIGLTNSIDRSVSQAIVDRSLDNTRDSASAGIKRLGPQ